MSESPQNSVQISVQSESDAKFLFLYSLSKMCMDSGSSEQYAHAGSSPVSRTKVPECCCLTFIALWESCLQIGLVPTNGNYQLFFTESTLAAQIADQDGQVLYRSQSAPMLTHEQMQASHDAPLMLSADERLQSAPVWSDYLGIF